MARSFFILLLCIFICNVVITISYAAQPDMEITWVTCPALSNGAQNIARIQNQQGKFYVPYLTNPESYQVTNAFKHVYNFMMAPSDLMLQEAEVNAVLKRTKLNSLNKQKFSAKDLLTLAKSTRQKRFGADVNADTETTSVQEEVADPALSALFALVDSVLPDSITQYVSPLESLKNSLKMKMFNLVTEQRRTILRQSLGHDPLNPAFDLYPNESENYKNRFSSIECAKITVPLLWDKPDDPRTITYFVKRFIGIGSTAYPKKGALFLLQGGPGADGSVFHYYASKIYDEMKDWDIYVPDHRGAGRSTVLDCSLDLLKRDRQGCYDQVKAKWDVDGLAGFSTTNAARDTLHFATLLKQQTGKQIAIYGGSYGTYLLNRILNIDTNNVVDLAVADGLVTPKQNFLDWDDNVDRVGTRWLQICAADTTCASKFGIATGDVEALKDKVNQFYTKQDSSNPCVMQLVRPGIKGLLSQRLMTVADRQVIMPFIYRALRCSSKDQVAIDNFMFQYYPLYASIRDVGYEVGKDAAAATPSVWDALTQERLSEEISRQPSWAPFAADEVTYSNSFEMMLNIKVGELAGAPDFPTRDAQVKRYLDVNKLFGMGASVSELDLYAPRIKSKEYYQDPLADKWALNYKRPLLMMSGTLDPQTEMASALQYNQTYANKAIYPHHYFTTFKNSPHIAMIQTITNLGYTCGMRVVAEWLRENGLTAPDTSCDANTYISTVSYKEWIGLPYYSESNPNPNTVIFGSDPWDGQPLSIKAALVTLVNTVVFAGLIVSSLVCCCCVVISAGVGMFFFAIRRTKKVQAKATNRNQFSRLA